GADSESLRRMRRENRKGTNRSRKAEGQSLAMDSLHWNQLCQRTNRADSQLRTRTRIYSNRRSMGNKSNRRSVSWNKSKPADSRLTRQGSVSGFSFQRSTPIRFPPSSLRLTRNPLRTSQRNRN